LITRLTPGVLLPPDHRHEFKILIPITLLDMTTIMVIDHGMSLSVLYIAPSEFKKRHFYFFPQNVKHPWMKSRDRENSTRTESSFELMNILIPITLLDMTTIMVIDHGMSLSVLYIAVIVVFSKSRDKWLKNKLTWRNDRVYVKIMLYYSVRWLWMNRKMIGEAIYLFQIVFYINIIA
jgi:hypothetical protein